MLTKVFHSWSKPDWNKFTKLIDYIHHVLYNYHWLLQLSAETGTAWNAMILVQKCWTEVL